MTRRTLAQPIVYPTINAEPMVVGAVPTMASKRRYGEGSQIGLLTNGNLAMVVPVQHPIAAQGAKYPNFPFVLPSDVAPDAIRRTFMSAQNFYSPSGHSKAKHTDEPIPAVHPDPNDVGFAMPRKALHGTGGNYTLPAPPNVPNFPVFIDRLQR